MTYTDALSVVGAVEKPNLTYFDGEKWVINYTYTASAPSWTSTAYEATTQDAQYGTVSIRVQLGILGILGT